MRLKTGAQHAVEFTVRIVERHALLILFGVSALYLAGTCGRASHKLLWHDELFTLHLARLSFSDVWAAIATPSDATPPFFHLLTRASLAVFGDGLITIRLPSILGFLLAMLSLYVFVARRYGPVYGLLASIIPVSTGAYPYAYEARAYGVVLGLSGVALVCWQAAAEGRRRALSVALLFCSLAAAISTHYYAVLLLAPLAVGEAVRFWTRRKADWPMWCALAASLAPLIAFKPLIQSARTIAAGWFSASGPTVVMESYEAVLAPLAMPLLGVLGLIGALFAAGYRSQVPDDGLPESAVPPYEWLAMVALLAVPVWGATLASMTIGSFVPRYALVWVLGLSVLAAFAAAAVSRHARLTGATAMLVLLAWMALKVAASAMFLGREPPTLMHVHGALLGERGGTLPIAVTHGHIFVPLAEYAPPEIASRLVLISLPTRLAAKLGESGDRALVGLAKWAPLQVQDFDAFLAGHQRFLLYGPPLWLTGELRSRGARLILKGEDQDAAPFAMSRPECVFLYEVIFAPDRGR